MNALNDSTRLLQPESRRGFALVELTISTLATTMLMAGLGAAIIIAARAMSPPVDQQVVLSAAEISSVVADDLQSAIHVTDGGENVVGFALADRSGDRTPESIRYEYSESRQTLTRWQGDQQGVLADKLSGMSFLPVYKEVAESLQGAVSETSPATLASVTSGGNIGTWYLTPEQSVGHFADISHPDNTVVWSVSAVRLALRRSTYYWPQERVIVQIREATGDGLPTSTILDESSMLVATLSTSWEWQTFSFSNADRLLTSQNICIVVLADDDVSGQSVRVAYTTSGYGSSGAMLGKSGYGYEWSQYPGSDLYFRISGTHHVLDDTSHNVIRKYVTGYDVRLTSTGHDQSIRRRVRLLNSPESLSGLWKLDFDTLPTADIDTDFDSISDWGYAGAGTFSGGIESSVLSISSGDAFETNVANDFTGLITIEAHCRATSISASGGAYVQVPFAADGTRAGLITVNVSLSENQTQKVSVIAADSGDGQLIAEVKNLPPDTVEVRIVVDAVSLQAAVWINERYQGRFTVAESVSPVIRTATFGASGAAAEFDFLSIRVGQPE